jgi:DNA polymerase I-like protein with 3'-5' exonuclease and polymerase domains
VHDELVVTTPRDKADRCLAIMREAMEGDVMQILTNTDGSIRVPVTANIKIVDRWAEAK